MARTLILGFNVDMTRIYRLVFTLTLARMGRLIFRPELARIKIMIFRMVLARTCALVFNESLARTLSLVFSSPVAHNSFMYSTAAPAQKSAVLLDTLQRTVCSFQAVPSVQQSLSVRHLVSFQVTVPGFASKPWCHLPLFLS